MPTTMPSWTIISRKKLPCGELDRRSLLWTTVGDTGRHEQAREHPDEGMGQERGGEPCVGDDTEARRRRTRADTGRCAGCQVGRTVVPV